MAKKRNIAWLIAGVIILAVVLTIFIVVKMMFKVKTYSYNTVDAVLKNPMMGFAPKADYYDAVGDNTLVYVDVTWRELEPKEGVFDFDTIEEENLLDVWRRQGKNVVFRFICDDPSDEEHIDIPDWLYEKTGDGVFYDTSYGKGYSPDYSNKTFIKYHEKAVQALGKRYGGDSFFCFIELGSVGHWGEWHVKYADGIKRLPSGEILEEYVKPYINAFPNSKLLMRRPFYYVSDYGMGVFNDMTGHTKDTNSWLSWIEEGGIYSEPEKPVALAAVPKVWERAPVGGEFTSSYTMDELLTDRLDETLELLSNSHMTFAGPMCPIANREEKKYPDEVGKVLEKIGYRYGISECKLSDNGFKGSTAITLKVNNYGTAPMYFDWKLCVYLIDMGGNVVRRYETDVELTEISENESVTGKLVITGDDRKRLKDGSCKLAVGIENPDTGKPQVKLDMDSDNINEYYYILTKSGKQRSGLWIYVQDGQPV